MSMKIENEILDEEQSTKWSMFVEILEFSDHILCSTQILLVGDSHATRVYLTLVVHLKGMAVSVVNTNSASEVHFHACTYLPGVTCTSYAGCHDREFYAYLIYGGVHALIYFSRLT